MEDIDQGAGRLRRRAALGAMGAAGTAAALAPSHPAVAADRDAEWRLPVTASARPGGGGPQGPFHAGDFGLVGVFDADWLPEPRYTRLLDMLAASPGAFGGVRFFGILNSGAREATFPTTSGTVWPAPEAPMDFAVPLRALEALVSRGLTPFVALTFFPAAVSPSPIAPPAGFGAWQALLRGFLDRVVERFGTEAVAGWWFEVWNEPNMPPFWGGDFARYLDLYRATAEAVRDSGHRLRLGGPALAWMPGEGPGLMRRFLEFLRDEPAMPCAFLSLHRKGIWVEEEAEPLVARLLEAAEATAAMARELVPGRCRDLPVVNNEADMKVGFDHPYAPRLSERFPSWLAALAIEHAALGARQAAAPGGGDRGFRFLAAADNANQHLVREPFDGRRALATRTDAAPEDLLKLPVFAFYELLRLLGDRHGSVEAPEGAFFPWSALHHAITVGEGQVGALLTLHPAEGDGRGGPVRLDYRLRDIPWPRVNLAEFRIDAAHANAFAAHGRRMPARLPPGAPARRLRAVAELGVAAPLRSGLAVPAVGLRLPLRLEPYATALVWVTPFDPTPPAAPGWIDVVAEAGNAVLRWAPGRAPGFWSYEVWRQTPGSRPRRIAPVPLRAAFWVDTAPPAGTYRYAVRCVSASGLRSAVVRSSTVRV